MHILFNPRFWGIPELFTHIQLSDGNAEEAGRAAEPCTAALNAENTSQIHFNLKTTLRDHWEKSPKREVHKKGPVKARGGSR